MVSQSMKILQAPQKISWLHMDITPVLPIIGQNITAVFWGIAQSV